MGEIDKMGGLPWRLLLAVPLLVVTLVATMWQVRSADTVDTRAGDIPANEDPMARMYRSAPNYNGGVPA